MLNVHLNMYQTMATAVLMLVAGQWLVAHVDILKKYCIPAPVVGGLIFALAHCALRAAGLVEFQLDTTLQSVFMTAFFCSVGFLAGFSMLKKGGVGVVKFLLLAVVAVVFQDVLGAIAAPMFGLDARLGLSMGSIALVGGHGTSASFGPFLEQMQVEGATTVAIASATYGLVAGCVIGGPTATARIRKIGLSAKTREGRDTKTFVASVDENTGALEPDKMMTGTILLVLAVGAGTVISLLIARVMNMPAYIGAMLAAAAIRNAADALDKPLPMEEIMTLGNICLSLFLSVAMINLKLWQLVSLAVPMTAILLAQTVFVFLFAYFVVFRVMGADYDAAAMSAGFCGFAMGATPNAVANMEAVTQRFGPSPVAFMIVPLVGALFIDFFNAAIITAFANWL